MSPPGRPSGECRSEPHEATPLRAHRPRTVAEALAAARALGVDRLDAQWLLAHHLQCPRAWVLAHPEAALPPALAAVLQASLRQRADGEPLAYLVGWQGFHGLELQVTPAVLVPRPDTETLVDWALELLAGPRGPLAAVEAPQVLDLGTGSGAIALAVKQSCPRVRMHALDCSPDALAVARANGERLGLAVQWWAGDWWRAVPTDAPRFHLLLSNPPYIAPGDLHLQALRHEPALALTPPGATGLEAIEAIAAGAPAHLAPGSWLLFEHGHDQAEAVQASLAVRGFRSVEHRQDLAGHRRCTGGCWPGG